VEFIRSFREILIDKNWLLGKISIGKRGLGVKKKRSPLRESALPLNWILRLAPRIFLFVGEEESPDAKEKGTEIA
jgi:hypothetical protein